MAPAAKSAGALLLVLLVGALVSTAEAARNPGLAAASVAAAPVAIASVHTSSMLGCMVGCGMQLAHCEISCANKPLLEGAECAFVCVEDNAKCVMACGAPASPPPPALGPAPPQA